MKGWTSYIAGGALIFSSLALNTACSNSIAGQDEMGGIASSNSGRKATEESKKYWYDGTAEITSYKLSQARYGEMREGTAVFVFVTEPFSKASNTKSDRGGKGSLPALKLNTTKKFNTGVYPYSLMTSTFFPFEGANTSYKTSFTMQEWCGTMFAEMRNSGDQLTFDLHSYFEGQSYKGKTVSPEFMEDDIWSLIRLNPNKLPKGESSMVPSMAYMRMKHVPLKSYKVEAKTAENSEGSMTFSLNYPSLDRTLEIYYESAFPHAIIGWEETYSEGGKMLTSKGERIKQIKSDYWNRNSNQDAALRTELGLD
jgi:hypothetical protein